MLVRSILAVIVAATGVTSMCAQTAAAQSFQGKPIRIVTSAVGGTNDIMARIISQEAAAAFGTPVIVDNRGGSGSIYAEMVAKSPPDGHTLLVTGNSFWTGPLLRKAPFDPIADFSAITMAATSPPVLVVHPSLPVKSVRQLISLAKSRPGELNYSSGDLGSGTHLTAELFNAMAGVKIVRVPYKGTGPALNGLLTGEAQLMFAIAGAAMATHVKSGRLRAIAVASPRPTALVPGLPTVAESGVPGFEALQILGVWAPGNTPSAIVSRLNEEIVRVLNRPDVSKRLFNIGVEVVGSSPQELAAFIRSDMAKAAKLIKDAGIRVE